MLTASNRWASASASRLGGAGRRRSRHAAAGCAPGPIALPTRLAGTTSRFVTALAALGAGPYDDRRCAAAAAPGRWRRCTMRSSPSAPRCEPGERLGPPSGHGQRPAARRRRRRHPRRRQQPVHHGADADRPVRRRRPAARGDDAAGVAPVPRDHRGGDGRLRPRRRRRSATTSILVGAGRYAPSTTRSSPTPARPATRWPLRRSAAGGSRSRAHRAVAAGRRRASPTCWRRWAASAARGDGVDDRRERRTSARRSTSTWSTCPISCRRSPPSPRSPTRRPRSAASASSAPRRATASATCAPSCAGSAPTADETDDGLVDPARRSCTARARHPPRPSAGDGVRPDRPAVAGVEIDDPDVVSKSWPGYWDVLGGLR